MVKLACRLVGLPLLIPAALVAQSGAAMGPRLGPAAGTVIVVGGGRLGADIYRAFIQAAGGPESLIVVVPTAGGGESYGDDYRGAAAWRAAGAHRVVVLHTTDRAVANSDSFAGILNQAGGVWFDGGRQYRLVDAYAGTRTEQGFHAVLARGGVVGGSSAGATILGDFLVRGAPSNNNFIMDDPSHEQGFAFVRDVAIDQHVVARERLPDLADSIAPRYPNLLPISADEGTAWVIRGDTGRIIGAGQAFAYQVAAHDPGKPFLTLHPGDVFDLAERRVVRRAIESNPSLATLADSLLAPYQDPVRGGVALLVALDGQVLIDRSFGIAPQPRYMPTTTVPPFDVGNIAAVFDSLCAGMPVPPARSSSGGSNESAAPTPFQACVARAVSPRFGLHRTSATARGAVESSVDELYRVTLGLASPPPSASDAAADREGSGPNRGWLVDTVGGAERMSAFGTPDGRRSALVRIPSRAAAIILLSNDPRLDARGLTDLIVDRLLESPRR